MIADTSLGLQEDRKPRPSAPGTSPAGAGRESGGKPLVSVIVPCFNEAQVLPLLKVALVDLGAMLAPKYRCEFVLVDDGSRDETWKMLAQFAAEDSRVRAVGLSRNFGHQMALSCGYDVSRGDAVVSLDADLQDPPEVVTRLLEEWENGADVVYAIRASREGETAAKRLTAAWFYRFFRSVSHSSAPADSGDFRLMSRRSVDALCALRERHRYLRGMAGWIGFRTAFVKYERKPRAAGTTKYPLRKMLAFALDGLISFSSFPLRLAYILALLTSSPVLLYLLYTLAKYILRGESLVPGWTSIILTITLFGTAILISLGLLGEYVGRIYEESKNRPLYLIREVATTESQGEVPSAAGSGSQRGGPIAD